MDTATQALIADSETRFDPLSFGVLEADETSRAAIATACHNYMLASIAILAAGETRAMVQSKKQSVEENANQAAEIDRRTRAEVIRLVQRGDDALAALARTAHTVTLPEKPAYLQVPSDAMAREAFLREDAYVRSRSEDVCLTLLKADVSSRAKVARDAMVAAIDARQPLEQAAILRAVEQMPVNEKLPMGMLREIASMHAAASTDPAKIEAVQAAENALSAIGGVLRRERWPLQALAGSRGFSLPAIPQEALA